jgi:hypothetical protein
MLKISFSAYNIINSKKGERENASQLLDTVNFMTSRSLMRSVALLSAVTLLYIYKQTLPFVIINYVTTDPFES